MDYLKNQHPDIKDDNVYLEESTHTYYINGESDYMSVTTFVGSLFEKFDADSIINNMKKSKNWPNNKYYGLSKEEIKQLWDDKKNCSANAGTQLHLDIEKFYNNMEPNNTSLEFKHFLRFSEKYKHLIPYRTEKIIYSKEFKLAGSIDMLFLDNENNCLQIYDWKRVKDITKISPWNKWIKHKIVNYLPDSNYWHYALQLNIYMFLYNRGYNGVVKHINLVSLHPENKSYIHIPVIDLQDEIEELLLERKRLL